MAITARMNRLFANDGKCLDVAMDHGIFNEPGFLAGIEDMRKAVAAIAAANPDAVQLTPGQADILQSIPGKHKPALVLRTDAANVYGAQLPRYLFSQLIDEPVKQAVRLDAACVVVNLLWLPGEPELHHLCVRNVCQLKAECERFGMPLMVEPLIMKPNAAGGGYAVDGNIDKIIPLVRQAVELGADIVKADPCDNVSDYHRVVQAASGKPVLPRGGGSVTEDEALRRTYELMKQGSRGIVYGRNIIQHHNPPKMTEALLAIIHEQANVEQALQIVRGNEIWFPIESGQARSVRPNATR